MNLPVILGAEEVLSNSGTSKVGLPEKEKEGVVDFYSSSLFSLATMAL